MNIKEKIKSAVTDSKTGLIIETIGVCVGVYAIYLLGYNKGSYDTLSGVTECMIKETCDSYAKLNFKK